MKIDGKDYKGDDGAHDDAATFYTSDDGWGFSSTGDFMDNNDDSNKPYTVNSTSADLGELYRTARMSPLSLTYYHQCLRNLNYSVTLHFAEIEFRNDGTYYSFGRRIFDIYIQVFSERYFSLLQPIGAINKKYTCSSRLNQVNGIVLTFNFLNEVTVF